MHKGQSALVRLDPKNLRGAKRCRTNPAKIPVVSLAAFGAFSRALFDHVAFWSEPLALRRPAQDEAAAEDAEAGPRTAAFFCGEPRAAEVTE